MDAQRIYMENSFTIPAGWTWFEISVKASRKIRIFQVGETVVLLRAMTGSNSWDTCDSWLEDGKLKKPVRGGQMIRDAITALADRINREGLNKALQAYRDEKCICVMCGANLTDPVSKFNGIGPECMNRVESVALLARLLS